MSAAADFRGRVIQDVILHVDEPRRHFRALDEPADAQKFPAFVVRQRRVGNAVKPVAAKADGVAKAVRPRGHLLIGIEAVHGEIEAVDVFPHFAGNIIANGARVFARLGDALHDGAGIILAKGEKFEDGAARPLLRTASESALLRRP